MHSNKYIITLIALILISSASSLELNAGENAVSVCPRSTQLFIDNIVNDESVQKEYTVNAVGEASAFATPATNGFILEPGESKAIYTYVTPFSDTLPKQYSLDVKISTKDSFVIASHIVNVRDCHILNTAIGQIQKETCPGETAQFEFNIQNNGEYQEIYSLYAEGEISEKISLSEEVIKLNPGESKTIIAYAKADPDDEGIYEFSVTADSQVSNAISTTKATLKVNPCYEYDVFAEEDFVEICEHSREVIPIRIDNKGSVVNTFNLGVEGPSWASVSNNKVTVNPGSSAVSELILTPNYEVEDGFNIEVEVTPEKGELKARQTFKAIVRKCHSVLVDIQADEDKICNSISNNYNVLVKNTGEVSKQFALEGIGPSWVTTDAPAQFSLDAGEEKSFIINVNPNFNTNPSDYDITLRAKALDDSGVSSEDTFTITTVSKEDCYKPKIILEKDSIDVYYDGSAKLPVIVENTGTYDAIYELGISDTASSFVELNPSVVEISPGDSEVVYVYIAPNAQIDDGSYLATISAKLPDSTILASEDLDIEIINVKPKDTIPREDKVSFWQKITGFFVSLFSFEPTNETESVEEIEIINETPDIGLVEEEPLEDITTVVEPVEEDITEEVVEEEPIIEEEPVIEETINETEEIVEEVTEDGSDVEEEITEEVVEESEPVQSGDVKCQINGVDSLDLVDSISITLTEDEDYEIIVKEQKHNIKVSAIDENSVFLIITSEPQQLLITEGETKNIDLDNDGGFDMKITLNEANRDNANFVFEKVEEENPVFKTLDYLKQYENYIIAGIIAVIILIIIIKTKFYQKAIDFFEEEIEEEDIKDEEKKDKE